MIKNYLIIKINLKNIFYKKLIKIIINWNFIPYRLMSEL